MVRWLGRALGWGGRAKALSQARAAELRGDLAHAAALFARGGRLDEAARVMLLRGDAEAEPAARLRHYVQAAATAPEGSPARTQARSKHAALLLAMAADGAGGPLGAAMRHDLALAARELEALGDHDRAAEAYARAGDEEGEARALARAGDVDRLDALLSTRQGRERDALARRRAHEEMTMLVATGRRREAAALARASGDEALRERGRALEARRVAGPIARVVLRGRPLAIALGDEVAVGRAATIAIASAAVSREHVALARRGGEVVVRDLGSRNGTTLRGLALAGEVGVGDGLELRLGGEVPLVVRPSTELPPAVALEVAGARYLVPLGPAPLGVGRWRLERGESDWVELATEGSPPAFADALQLADRVALVAGDCIAAERGADPVLEVPADGR